jgi:hypothetical protein
MEVGSISIAGTIDTANIERGANRINNSLSEIKSNTESSFGSFERLKSVTSSVAGSLVKIGTVGLTAMSGLASLSPQVAPAMAKIANETRRLSFALGEQLQPLFASIGNDLIPAIGTAIDRFSPQITGLVNAGVTGISDISNALRGEWDKIDNIVPKSAGALIGAAAGFSRGGFTGMLIGASLGHAIGDKLLKDPTEGMSDEEIEEVGMFGRTKATFQDFTGGISDFYSEAKTGDFSGAGSYLWGSVNLGPSLAKNAVVDIINALLNMNNEKDMTFAGETD